LWPYYLPFAKSLLEALKEANYLFYDTNKTASNCQGEGGKSGVALGSLRGAKSLSHHLPLPLIKGKGEKGGWGYQVKD